MKIAILASGSGEKALYLHEFFKEGNRLSVERVLTDFPDSDLARRFKEEGIDIVDINSYNDMEAIARNLKDNGVELIVVDGYVGPLPPALARHYAGAVVYPSAVSSAPLEVIEVADRLFAAPKTKKTPQRDPDRAPTLEEEWAEVLKIDYDEEEAQENSREPQAEEITSADNPVQENQGEDISVEEAPSQPEYHASTPPPVQPMGPPPVRDEHKGVMPEREPMPPTYLVWSVIITLVCCLIPGVVAIIYSANVSSKYYAGDIEGAKRASRNAQIWCIVSIVAGIIWATLYLPLSLLGSIQ